MKLARFFELFFCVTLSVAFYGCDGGDSDPNMDMDGGIDSGTPFVPPSFGEWVKYELEGAVCANGSQYKYFVNFADDGEGNVSENFVFYFEPGGACWDYESCTQDRGIRGAANTRDCVGEPSTVDCLPDDHASRWFSIEVPPEFVDLAEGFGIVDGKAPVSLAFPLLSDNATANPMHDWNKVWVSYCTGDVHSGNKVVTYANPDDSSETVEFHHVGNSNTKLMIAELASKFPSVGRMMVTGCSAGGTGALANYYFLRNGLNPQQGYLLDDAGPIYPDQDPLLSHSLDLHDEVRAVWRSAAVLESVNLPEFDDILEDFGNINTALATLFPTDRLTFSFFRLDYNYSLYSYERFNESPTTMMDMLSSGEWKDRAFVYDFWNDDMQLLRTQLDSLDNLGYFFPFFRNTNASHCITIPGFDDIPGGADDLIGAFLTDIEAFYYSGTELMTDDGEVLNIKDYIEHLLDDSVPLRSYFEETPEGRYQACHPSCTDEVLCSMRCEGAIDDEDFEAQCITFTEEERASYQCPPIPVM